MIAAGDGRIRTTSQPAQRTTADTKYRDHERLHQQDYDAYSIFLQVLRNGGSVEVQHRRLMSLPDSRHHVRGRKHSRPRPN